MSVLLDEPLWPAHGRMWAHLISDTSIDELHAFAGANVLPRRAFDLDHYDVPADACARLIEAGARPVDSHTLVRTLIGSGLRVKKSQRPPRR